MNLETIFLAKITQTLITFYSYYINLFLQLMYKLRLDFIYLKT